MYTLLVEVCGLHCESSKSPAQAKSVFGVLCLKRVDKLIFETFACKFPLLCSLQPTIGCYHIGNPGICHLITDVELQHVCFCICSVSVSSKKLRLVYSSHLKWVKKTTIWKLETLMPLISKSYMTKNDYYMKIGDIIEILMCLIFI